MYKVGYLCAVDVLPPLAKAIQSGDLGAVKTFPRKELEMSITLAPRTSLYPLELGICWKQYSIINYLLDENIMPPYQNLKESVRYLNGDVLDRLLNVYNVDAFDDAFKTQLFSSVGYGSNFAAIKSLEKHGMTANKYGGEALCSACVFLKLEEVSEWLRLGADVNYRSRDSLDTPLHIAVTFKCMELARLLVEQYHADLTIRNGLGFRPYTTAALNANEEFMAYLHPREPAELHDVERIDKQLDEYGFPATLRTFLAAQSLVLTQKREGSAEEQPLCQLVPLDAVACFTTEVTLPDDWDGSERDEEEEEEEETAQKPPNRKTFLAFGIQKESNEHLLVYCVDTRKVGFYDVEHGCYYETGDWDSFVADPAKYIDNMYT